MGSFFDHSTNDNDKGFLAIMSEMIRADESHVDIGLVDDEPHEDSEYTVPQIGAVHEFGTKDGRVPERSWLRSTEREQGQKWRGILDKGYEKILKSRGQVKVISILTAFGERAASDVRRKITTLRTPPLAASTIRRRRQKNPNPLVDTGTMRNWVRSRIVIQGDETKTKKVGK